ncbi:hypothetical protein [Holdemania sp. 1001302B_160321_E10]|uniref:hypothetical protein n=1 Tax=Holdemania sp. 1001302B_160321_E10 TaxID=2787120 RepID=UPI0018985EC1|nr:hypothetical protein [Holdemania sp. 1001302B_160321_E10]
MRKTKNKTTMLLAGGLAVVLILFAAAAIYFGMIVKDRSGSQLPEETEKPVMVEQGGQEKPQETQGLDAVEVDLVNATVYRFDELDFQFAIAKIRVKAEEPINISLEHFATSEGVKLNDIDSYLDQLDKNGLYIGKQNVWFELVSRENSYVANIFVPIKDKTAQSATINVDFGDNAPIQLNLKEATGTREMLGYVAEDVITDGKTYQMQVNVAFQIANEEVYRNMNGELMSAGIPSTAAVYVFKVEAVSLWGDNLEIESARYVLDDGSEFDALDAEYESEKYENILGKSIQEKDTGVLFFVTYNPDKELISYHGTLKLKIKGQENWIDVKVNL